MCDSETDSQLLPLPFCVSQRQSVSVTDSLFPPQTVCICHRQSMFVTPSIYLLQTVIVIHRQSVPVFHTIPEHSWSQYLLFDAWFPSKYVYDI